MTVNIHPSTICGTITAPPSKSMAHRLLICAALAEEESTISNLAHSVDINATAEAMRTLGATVSWEGSCARVKGVSLFAKRHECLQVNCFESGSTLRFLIPMFTHPQQSTKFIGATRLFQRPLAPYAEIYSALGLTFLPQEDGLTVQGSLSSGRYELAGNISSQFISGLLFVLPLFEGDSEIIITPPFESRGYVEMTRHAQAMFGVKSHWKDEHTLSISGGQRYVGASAAVEGDWSQAAVPAVMAAVCGNIIIEGLSEITAQADSVILDVLRRAGASVRWENSRLIVTPASNGLHGAGEIDMSDCPDLGPILCALGLFCKGETRLINAARLRIKESDRIASVEQELSKMGGSLHSGESWVSINGNGTLCGGGTFSSHNDHRVVMSLTAAAACGNIPITIENAQAVQKSWPNFFEDMRKLSLNVDSDL